MPRARSVDPTEQELMQLAATDTFRKWRRESTREEYQRNKKLITEEGKRSTKAALCCQSLCLVGLMLSWGTKSGIEMLFQLDLSTAALLGHIASYTPLLYGSKDAAAILICLSYLSLIFITSSHTAVVGTAPLFYASISCFELWMIYTVTDTRSAILNYDPILGRPVKG